MSRTDKTRPWRLREEAEPMLTRILNTEMNAWGRRELWRWWHAERFRVRQSLKRARTRPSSLWNADQPAPTRTRHSVRWDMW